MKSKKNSFNKKNNYEAVLFQSLAYAFGLKVNAQIFQQLAASLDFSIVNKIRLNLTQLEALFFGMSNWIEKPLDEEMKIWKREFDFLQTKYGISPLRFTPKFSKLRPPNFPTVRLAQFASLYHLHQNLFSKVVAAKNVAQIYHLFNDVKAGEYWDSRFSFGKISPVIGKKRLTKDFIDLLLINAILPLKYAYHKNSDENICDDILDFYRSIPPEKNTVLLGWLSLNMKIGNALESQAFLYHHKNFCLKKNCLNCGIAFKLLQQPA